MGKLWKKSKWSYLFDNFQVVKLKKLNTGYTRRLININGYIGFIFFERRLRVDKKCVTVILY